MRREMKMISLLFLLHYIILGQEDAVDRFFLSVSIGCVCVVVSHELTKAEKGIKIFVCEI